MKNISYGDTQFLTGDLAADTLVEYAVLMARSGTSDAVTIAVLSPAGADEDATFVIGPATMLVAETIDSDLSEPENDAAVIALRGRIEALTAPPTVIAPSDISHHLDNIDEI